MYDRRHEISEVFRHLIDLPEVQRGLELERLKAQDEELAQAVGELLEADAAGGFQPPPEPLPYFRSSAQIGIGSRIGVYEIRRLLGEGSCGKVFQAERVEGFPQSVAIKVLHGHLDPKPCMRFELETQTLALLDHPHIVRLYDCGTTETGLPYIVTEFVDGEHLTAYCDRNKLGLDDRVTLVATAARAMAYAHENEVLHRDLCPSNVMVTRQGTVKIIDFGLVHVLKPEAKTVLTDKGITIGTPGYVAPEMISGRGNRYSFAVDTYGMGAVLYRLITNRPTFPGNSPYEICHAATVSDPVSPRRIDPRIPRDLETIVFKAMARDPAERFETMEAFVEQLDLYLARKPLTIEPPSIREKLEKWAIRHRDAVLATLGVAAGVLTVLLGVLTSTNFRVNAALSEARLDRERAERSNFIIKAFLKDMTLASVELTEAMPLGSNKTHEYLQRMVDIAERAIVEIPRNRMDTDYLYRAGLAHHHLARSFQARNAEANRPLALEHYGRAIDLFGQAVKLNSKKEWYRYNLARSLAFRAFVKHDGGEAAKAVEDSREATKIAIELNRDFPGIPEWIDAEAFHHITLAGFYLAASDYEGCRREAEACLKVARELIAKYPERPLFLANEYRALTMLEELAERDNRLDEAKSLTLQAMKVNETQAVRTPDEGHYLEGAKVSLLSKLARIEGKLGNLDAAAKSYEETIELAGLMAKKYPLFDAYLLLPIRMQADAARYHAGQGNEALGKSFYEKAIASLETLVTRRPELIEARKLLAEIFEKCPVEELRNPERARTLIGASND
jgi:serine/threonine protein kinase/tetratricopeptide (TPR) repeat protein